MPVTVTVDTNFIYAMLKEYNDAVKAKNIGGTSLDSMLLVLLYYNNEVDKYTPRCNVYSITGGAKIVCSDQLADAYAYTTNGAAYRFQRTVGTTTYTYELFRVSFPEVAKGSWEILTVTATAVLTVG